MRTRNIAPHPFGLIIMLIVATFILEPVALAQVNPSWIPTGNLSIPRSGRTATLLANGKVLAAGPPTGRRIGILNWAGSNRNDTRTLNPLARPKIDQGLLFATGLN